MHPCDSLIYKDNITKTVCSSMSRAYTLNIHIKDRTWDIYFVKTRNSCLIIFSKLISEKHLNNKDANDHNLNNGDAEPSK